MSEAPPTSPKEYIDFITEWHSKDTLKTGAICVPFLSVKNRGIDVPISFIRFQTGDGYFSDKSLQIYELACWVAFEILKFDPKGPYYRLKPNRYEQIQEVLDAFHRFTNKLPLQDNTSVPDPYRILITKLIKTHSDISEIYNNGNQLLLLTPASSPIDERVWRTFSSACDDIVEGVTKLKIAIALQSSKNKAISSASSSSNQ